MGKNRYKVTGLLDGLSSTTMHRFLKSAEKAAEDLTDSEIYDTLEGKIIGGTSKLAKALAKQTI